MVGVGANLRGLAALLPCLAVACSDGAIYMPVDARVADDAGGSLDAAAGADAALPPGTLGSLAEQGAPAVIDSWPTVNYRGTDTAWSAAVGRFLLVYGNAPIGAAWLDGDGRQQGSGFRLTVDEYDGANWTQNPRVIATDDAFLVSWFAEDADGPVVVVRRVNPALDAPEVRVSAPGAFQESAAALAWSAATREAVVVWAHDGLHLRRLGADGTPLADVVDLTEAGVWVEQPSAVAVPGCGCLFVTTMRSTDTGAEVLLLRVEDGSGALLEPPRSLSGDIDFAKVTDVELDAARGEVIASWYEIRGGTPGFAAQRFAADGSALGAARTVFAPHGSYDGYDLAWSPVSGTSLASFHGQGAAAGVAELSVAQEDGPVLLLDDAGATNGVFLPRSVALPTRAGWLVASAPDYARVLVQTVARQ